MTVTHTHLSLNIDNVSLDAKNVMFDLNQCFPSMLAEVANLGDMLWAPTKHLILYFFTRSDQYL